MTPENSSISGTERQERRVPRFNFVATVDLNDPASGMRITGRVSELSRHGCYVDSLNQLPVGTILNVKIFNDQGEFLSKGKVVYAQERIGMGVGFLDPTDDQLKVLDRWLAELPPDLGRPPTYEAEGFLRRFRRSLHCVTLFPAS